jgi:5'-3' exonuclease
MGATNARNHIAWAHLRSKPVEVRELDTTGPSGPGSWHPSRVATTFTRLVLDSPSLIYRAFFALPRTIRDPGGQPVNAVRGYLDMLSRLLLDHHPSGGVVNVFDADWRPQWRVDAYPGYKARRPEDPPELPAQVPLIRALLEAAGLPVAEAPGYEADDVIGTIASAAGPDERIAVVTGDRDLFQLVRDPVVIVLFPRKGTSDLARMDEAGVAAKTGVPPDRYVDFAILRGDPSDGLPGVAGVGEKTAARLVAEFPGLDELVAQRDRLPPRLAGTLERSGDYLDAMRRIVPVATGIDYQVTAAAPPDRERLGQLAERHGIESPVRRLLAALDRASAQGQAIQPSGG